MRAHDAVFLESISSIAIVVLGATMVFMGFLVVPVFLGMFLGYVSLDLSSTKFLSIVFEIILGMLCYSAIGFLLDFRKNKIDPFLSA